MFSIETLVSSFHVKTCPSTIGEALIPIFGYNQNRITQFMLTVL
jgi:hypothetical protein